MSKLNVIILMVSLFYSCTQNSIGDFELLAIGTYTKKEGHVDGKADGIYIVKMNISTGQLSIIDTIENIVNPSYLTIHPITSTIYAVSEIADETPNDIGTVTSIKMDINQINHKVTNSVLSAGDAPCHIMTDASGGYLIVSNYLGSVSSFKINQDQSISQVIDVKNHVGGDTSFIRQDAPHPHMSITAPDNQSILVSDLGANCIVHYIIEDGMLIEKSKTQMIKGAGPRHIAINNQKVYVLNELNRSIEVFEWVKIDQPMNRVQAINTLAPIIKDKNIFASAIKIHPSGKYLYIANRGLTDKNNQTISVFSIDDQSGQLSFVQSKYTKGQIPRDFEIDPSGKYLLVANQNSDNIVTFSIDADTGQLMDTNYDLNIATPVCIKFFPKS